MHELAYISLGGNLGPVRHNFASAAAALRELPEVIVLRSSSLYQSTPVGGPPDQPDYLNAVLEISTKLMPGTLLTRLQEIELRHHRRRTGHHSPRTLDLDVLLFGDVVAEHPDLHLPHPRLHLRRFVLIPLAELRPDLCHPVFKITVTELLEQLALVGQEVHRVESPDGWLNRHRLSSAGWCG